MGSDASILELLMRGGAPSATRVAVLLLLAIAGAGATVAAAQAAGA